MKRRQLVALPVGLALVPLGPLISSYALASFGARAVVWGGSGFNVPNDEINLRLERVNRSLEAGGQAGWKRWIDSLLSLIHI